jgi:hypothetical protein
VLDLGHDLEIHGPRVGVRYHKATVHI